MIYRGSSIKEIIVGGRPTVALKLTMEPTTVKAYGGWSTTFAGKLTDEMGNGIPGQEIKFYLNGRYKVSVLTDKFGEYTLAYAWITEFGDYQYELRYEPKKYFFII